MENTIGATAVRMKAIGRTIKCMGRECIIGRTAENTKEITLTIKKRVMANTLILMEGVTKASGKIQNSMVKESL